MAADPYYYSVVVWSHDVMLFGVDGKFVPFCPPKGLSAGEADRMVRGRGDPRQTAALLLGLAYRGYVELIEVAGDAPGVQPLDWEVRRCRLPDRHVRAAEYVLLAELFARARTVRVLAQRRVLARAARRAGVRLSSELRVARRGWSPRRGADPDADGVEAFRRAFAAAGTGQLWFSEGQDLFGRYLPWAVVFNQVSAWSRVCARLAECGQVPPSVHWYLPLRPWSYGGHGTALGVLAPSLAGARG